jgi:hypothetical protein
MVKFGVLFEVRTEFLNNAYSLDEFRLQRVNVDVNIDGLRLCLSELLPATGMFGDVEGLY